MRRRQRPHEPEVVVRRNPLRLRPDHLHVTDRSPGLLADDLAGTLHPASLRGGSPGGRVLCDLEPSLPLHDEPGPDQGLEGLLHTFRGRAKQLRQLLDLDVVVPDVRQDAEQLVEGDGLGAYVGHPAHVQPGAASPRPPLTRRCEPEPLHPARQYKSFAAR